MEKRGVSLNSHSGYHFMLSEYNQGSLHILFKMFGSPSLRRLTRSFASDVDVIAFGLRYNDTTKVVFFLRFYCFLFDQVG